MISILIRCFLIVSLGQSKYRKSNLHYKHVCLINHHPNAWISLYGQAQNSRKIFSKAFMFRRISNIPTDWNILWHIGCCIFARKLKWSVNDDWDMNGSVTKSCFQIEIIALCINLRYAYTLQSSKTSKF